MNTAENETAINYKEVSTLHDPFNGLVCIFENVDLMSEARFWVEHQRKDIYTDYMTLADAEAKQLEFVSDTMF